MPQAKPMMVTAIQLSDGLYLSVRFVSGEAGNRLEYMIDRRDDVPGFTPLPITKEDAQVIIDIIKIR